MLRDDPITQPQPLPTLQVSHPAVTWTSARAGAPNEDDKAQAARMTAAVRIRDLPVIASLLLELTRGSGPRGRVPRVAVEAILRSVGRTRGYNQCAERDILVAVRDRPSAASGKRLKPPPDRTIFDPLPATAAPVCAQGVVRGLFVAPAAPMSTLTP